MKKKPAWLFIVACSAAIIIAGTVITRWTAVHADRYLRNRLMLQAVAIARQVNIEQVNALSFSLADKDSPVFQRLRSQMVAYSPAVKSLFGTEDRFLGIYSMMMKGGKIYFGPENIDVNDPRSSVPGAIYERPPSELLRVFASGSPLVLGPYTDEFGTFISAFAPVLDPQTGKTAIIIGMDFEAKGWKSDIARASMFPVIITLILLLVLAGSSMLVFRRSRTAPGKRGSILRNTDAVIAATFGLVITLTAAYVAHINEMYDHKDAFSQLAASKAFGFTQVMTDIRDDYLEGFSRFIESRPELDLKQFNEYSGFLKSNYVVQAWAWIPRVSEKDREVFVRQVRSEGQAGFTLWQSDAAGEPIPVDGKNEYYPICYAEPLSGNERALGFDISSEPIRRKAFENSARTGLVTGTDAVTLVNIKGSKKGIVIFRPVYGDKGRRNLRGFTSASVIIETLLKKYISDEPFAEHPSVFIDLYEMKEDSPGVLLASMSPGHSGHDFGTAIVMPVFAFGKAYAVLAHQGTGFSMLYPEWAGWLTGVTGIAFTALSVLFIIFLSGRRIALEEQVLQRTEELRASEESYRKQFTDNSSVMLLIDPEDDRIIDANLSAAEFYGYPREKLCDMRGMQLDPAQGKEALKTKPFVDSGAVKYIKTRHRLASGQVRDVEIFSSSILLEKKKLLQFIVHDITERMKMEDELKRKVTEFEIMNKVAINRELRMVELKEKIVKMEERIRKEGGGGTEDKGQTAPS